MISLPERLSRPLLTDNPVTVQVLGLCSALAVSSSLRPALIMAMSVIAVMLFSSVSVSLLRQIMPRSIRLILEVTLIASAVVVVDEVLKVVAPDIAYVLSVFIGLIITNCIVLGRVEAFALHNPIGASFLDALGNAMGYALVLLLIAALREFFGAGSLFGTALLPDSYPRNEMMQYAPSAFFLLGLIVWGGHAWQQRATARRAASVMPKPGAGR